MPDLLRRRGIEAKAGGTIHCPLPGHDDTNASFSVLDGGQAFCCHGCGRKGDVLTLHSLLHEGTGTPTRDDFEACAALAGVDATQPTITPAPKATPQASGKPKGGFVYATAEDAAAAIAWGMDREAARKRKPQGWHSVQSWTYRNPDGTEAGQVLRLENGTAAPETGKPEKTIRPLARVFGGWRIGDPEGGFPLYRLPQLADAPNAPVFVCEGEKATDALAGLGLAATTWAHGAKAADKADFEPLAGRRVFLVPDNDEAGRSAMATVAQALLALEPPATPHLLELPDLPEKGDAVEFIDECRADSGMGDASIRERIEALADALAPCAPPSTEGTTPHWLEECRATYGEPVTIRRTRNGETAYVNERATAGAYYLSRALVRDPALCQFYEYREDTGLWAATPETCVRNSIAAFLGKLLTIEHSHKNTASVQCNLLTQVEGMAARMDPFRERPENAVHLANGMLFLESGVPSLRPFGKEYHSRNRTEIEWKPGATCPRFLGELLEPAIAPDDIALVQKYIGQCLLGRNPSQTFLVLRGTPGGGKGTLCRVIEAIVGRPNVGELRVPHLDRPFELARLANKTLLVAHDVPGDFMDHPSAATIKKLVGGDSQEGEIKGSSIPIPIHGQYNIIISTNTRLRVKLDSDAGAWERRLLLVDYERPKPEHPVPDFDKQLVEEEGPGILQWAVAGAQALLQDLAEGKGMTRTATQSRRVNDLLTESDSVRAFVAQCVAKVEPPGGLALDSPKFSATTEELSAAYSEFCDAKGWEAVSVRAFERTIQDAMRDVLRVAKRTDIKRDGKNRRGFYGVRLATGPLAEETP